MQSNNYYTSSVFLQGFPSKTKTTLDIRCVIFVSYKQFILFLWGMYGHPRFSINHASVS